MKKLVRDLNSKEVFRLTKIKKQQYYYHITTNKNWGDKIKLSPINSDGLNDCHRAEDEPVIARTCVGTTIAGCVNAVYPSINHVKKIYVYRTLRKITAYEPMEVCDSYITQEKWLLSPAVFVKIGELVSPKLWGMSLNYPCGSWYSKDLKRQEKAMKELIKAGCLLKHKD